MMGADVALKIGHGGQSPSGLSHEYSVYVAIAGSTGISPVHWYGKEGKYEIIVLEHLGTSLDDLISKQKLDYRKTSLYASQMVSSLYT